MKKIVPSFRRYSEPFVSEFRDEVDCRRIPPLHDFVETKNEKNEKLCSGEVEGELEAAEEIDEEWFMKVAKRSDGYSDRVPPYDGVFDGEEESCISVCRRNNRLNGMLFL